ncbi:substrate-binding domain-containing protein [Oleiagrimonas soli]|uniref:Phosphate transport system substrate-binding protein n=1 Tax=Oleiagrimonas soli TaxID=1543381 RepID=A0A841KGS6_9GAMM|nr:substrate-binding domain-containing protein [Oleiagrimonas soli]MBB6184372.1 phosphate transport system substrate-binding protein [Oleiagrimonas soli]
MKIRLRFIAAFALLSVGGAAVAHGGRAPAGQPLTWRGDVTTARAFVDDMASAWRHSGHARVTLEPFNTISALDQLSQGQVDIAGTARGVAPRRPEEKGLQFTPVAWDALVIITNHRNPVRGLTLKQLHDIYFGKIRNWNQVGGRNAPINVYAVASPSDGVEFSLRRLLYGRGNQPVAAPRLYINVQSLEKGIALDPDGLGVSTLSGVHGNPKLKMLAIDGVSPSTAHVADGSYALYSPLYLVTRSDEHNASAQAFIDFTASATGKRILRKHGLVPYTDGPSLAQGDDERMARIADAVGRVIHNGPTAAPRATYTSRTAIAPTSPLTRAARDRMLDKQEREQDNRKAAKRSNAANAAATAKANDTQG